jgi:uncharacterized protein
MQIAPSTAIGVGLTYRPFLQKHILEHADALDFVEIAASQYINPAQQRLLDRDGSRLDEITRRRRCVVRGTSLSIGSVEPIDNRLLLRLRAFLERTGAVSFSDYLAFDRLGTFRLGIPQALPYCDNAARWVARRYEAVRSVLGSPFVLDIIAYSFPAPLSCWTEIEFIVRVAEYTDCALSLDLAALLINSHNHHYDPLEFLLRLPRERVVQLRIAGLNQQSNLWRHDLSRAGPEQVFELLDAALEATDADRVIVGREGGYFPFAAVMAEVSRAREVFKRHRACVPGDRRHFELGRRAGEAGAMPDNCNELDEDFSALHRYQHGLLECCLTMAGDAAGLQSGEAFEMIGAIPAASLRALAAAVDSSSGAGDYLRELSQEEELVTWMMKGARARRR